MKKSKQAELQEIEKLLGEDFETLAEARAALKRESKPTVTSRQRNKTNYSLRELPEVKGKTVTDLLVSIEQNREAVDALRKPGELWAAEFTNKHGSYKIYRAFEDVDLLAKYLSRYDSVQKFGNKVGANNTELIKAIKLIKFKGTAKQYFNTKQNEVKEYESRVKEAQQNARDLSKRARKLEREKSKEISKQAKLASRLMKAENKARKMKQQLDQMEQKIKDLKAGKTPKRKKSVKKVSRKKTTRRMKRK